MELNEYTTLLIIRSGLRKDTNMMLDSNGLPVTKNHAGYDGGDSLANFCRWTLGKALNGKTPSILKLAHYQVLPGVYVRHPGTGDDPEGKPFLATPSFWSDPKELSRDNTRALMWLLYIDKSFSMYELFMHTYRQRKYLTAQNGDIMFPFILTTNHILLLLRDFELLVNTSIVCGLIPLNKHDNPNGFGKGKRWFFSWQDSDWCDGDANMVTDLAGCKLVKETLISKLCTWIYRKVRGAKYIRHYYRSEAGNNPEIAEEFVQGLKL